jgi:hypothetical protein
VIRLREYQIPRNVSSKFEFWPGFGWIEFAITLAGLLAGLVLRWLVLIITHSQWSLLLVVAGGSVGYFLVKPFGPGADSFLVTMQRFKQYKIGQKLYLYQKGR